jgi:hypothetical protein
VLTAVTAIRHFNLALYLPQGSGGGGGLGTVAVPAKGAGARSYYSHACSAKVKNEWSCKFATPYALMA